MLFKTESFVNPLNDSSGYTITPEILLWRSVLVRVILDSLGVDIHAWGYVKKRIIEDSNLWFDKNNKDFIMVCDYADLNSDFVLRLFNKIKNNSNQKRFKNINLNKFFLEYLCTFTGEK